MTNPIINYVKESIEELKRVVWPSRQEAVQHTLLVLGISAAVAIFLGAVDYILNYGLEKFFTQ